MRKTTFLSLLLFFVCAVTAMAQMQDPVHFKSELKQISGTEAEIVFTATIDDGWHVYSTDLPDGGPISATFNVDKIEGAELVGKLTPVGKEENKFDQMFQMQVRFFEHNAKFVQKLKITGATFSIEGYMQYGACNDQNCLPPTDVNFSFKGKGDAKAAAATPAPSKKDEAVATETSEAQEADTLAADATAANDSVAAGAHAAVSGDSDLWTPVIKELNVFDNHTESSNNSWLYIFFAGFVGGLIALFTPCVWPIIPMTVSFFL